jgi:hypothetical protein
VLPLKPGIPPNPTGGRDHQAWPRVPSVQEVVDVHGVIKLVPISERHTVDRTDAADSLNRLGVKGSGVLKLTDGLRPDEAVASGWSGPGQLQSRVGAREEGEDFADGGFLGGGFGQREAGLDLVAVAAAVFLLDQVAGYGQAGDDAVGAALGDVQAGRDVARPGRGRCATAPGRGWSGSSSSSS